MAEYKIVKFFEQYYPGTKVKLVRAESPEQLRRVLSLPEPTPEPEPDPILLWMKDARWAGTRYGGGDCSTIGAQGCWLTDCAMAQRYYGIDSQATPLTVDAAIGPSGYSNCSMRWDAMPRIGLQVIASTTDLDRVRTHLADGGVCFVDVYVGTAKHFVLVTRCDGERFWCYDPLKGVAGWLGELYAVAESWRLVQPVQQPEPTFRPGVHDQAGAEWMVANGVEGWAVIPLYLGESAQIVSALPHLADAGIDVILNLRYSWATGSGPEGGGQGTLPPAGAVRDRFVAACVETVRQNPDAWGFCLCNEMNNSREWPIGGTLTAEEYVAFYNRVYDAVPQWARIAPGAIDPTNAGWGDWRPVWREMLESLAGAEFLALHAYCHGPNLALITHGRQFGDVPLVGVYYDLRMLESLQAVVPARFADLPQVVTETNHLYRSDGVTLTLGWDDDGAWVQAAFDYFEGRGVAGACLFRYNYDVLRFGDKPRVLEALKSYRRL